jgi:hypothetical protein
MTFCSEHPQNKPKSRTKEPASNNVRKYPLNLPRTNPPVSLDILFPPVVAHVFPAESPPGYASFIMPEDVKFLVALSRETLRDPSISYQPSIKPIVIIASRIGDGEGSRVTPLAHGDPHSHRPQNSLYFTRRPTVQSLFDRLKSVIRY